MASRVYRTLNVYLSVYLSVIAKKKQTITIA